MGTDPLNVPVRLEDFFKVLNELARVSYNGVISLL